MSALAEFTKADGKKIGIARHAAVIVLEVKEPPEDHAKAKSLLRYTLDGRFAHITYLRDTFRQVLNVLPTSCAGPWVQAKDPAGAAIAFPQGSVAGFEEIEDGKVKTTLSVPTGPIEIVLKAAVDDVRKLTAHVVEPESEG